MCWVKSPANVLKYAASIPAVTNTSDRPPAKHAFLRRRSSDGGLVLRAPMAVSVNAVHLHGRKKPVGSGGPQQKRQHRRDSRGRLSQTHEVGATSPLLRLRASEGRRAKPSLRRKRVATMRSVDGWVRESDPASTRRQASLDRRMVELRKRRNQIPRNQRKGSRSTRDCGGARRHSNATGSGTFLTELETDGVLRGPATGPNQGNGGTESWTNGRDAPRRRSTVKTAQPRPYPTGVAGGPKNSATAQRQQARRRSSGAQRGPASTEPRTRKATVSAKIPRRSRSEGARVKVRIGRTKSVGALGRHGEHQAVPSRIKQSSARGEAWGRNQEGQAAQAKVPAPATPQPADLSGELDAGGVVTDNPVGRSPSHPDGAWNSPSPGRTTGYGGVGVALVRQPHAPRYSVENKMSFLWRPSVCSCSVAPGPEPPVAPVFRSKHAPLALSYV